MEDLENRVVEATMGVIKNYPELFLVDVKIKGNIGNQKVLIFIDSDTGLDIDQCSMVSKGVGEILEEGDLMDGKYTLEVSSPGLDHPIKLMRQYKKNIGRRLEVEHNNGELINGELLDVKGNSIILKTSNKEKSIDLGEINKSKIELSFK